MRRLFRILKDAILVAVEHDVLNSAKAAAYSGMLMLFPALVVLTTLLATVPEGSSLVGEVRGFFEQFLPADSMSLLQSSFETRRSFSVQLLVSATFLTFFAGLGVMLSLMEGFRRSYRQSRSAWGFWERRLWALLLVPIVMLPLALATVLLVFGRQFEAWMILNAGHELRWVVLLFWRLTRWAISLGAAVAVLAALYHFGIKRGQGHHRVLPGAVLGTLVWFPATLAFGWYVTRIADYSMFYGSFGAGIATLVWLYLSSFSALLGAEVNGVLFREASCGRTSMPQEARKN